MVKHVCRALGLLFCLLPLPVLTGCGGALPGDDRPDANAVLPLAPTDIDETQPPLVDIEGAMVFDRGLPASNVELLRRDIRRIERTSLDTGADSEQTRLLRTLLEVDNLRAETLSRWLRERVSVIIDSDLSRYSFAQVESGARRYGVFQIPRSETVPDANTVATMVGVVLYKESKRLNREDRRRNYLMIQVNDQWVHLHNQRNGVMQVGPALFDPAYQPNAANPQAFVNSALRIATLFHEARHADGNELRGSLGFLHAICEQGELAGKPACDASSNGPYAVSYRMLKAYLEKCNELCTARERSVLSTIMLDNYSRLLSTTSPELTLDTTPERGFQKVDISSFQAINLR